MLRVLKAFNTEAAILILEINWYWTVIPAQGPGS
jgi:hypothetical protein